MGEREVGKKVDLRGETGAKKNIPHECFSSGLRLEIIIGDIVLT